MDTAIALVVLVVCGFYALLLGSVLMLRSVPRLSPPDRAADPAGAVAVVIAARDEAHGISACLESLLLQKGLGQIIVVDDHSQDDTAQLASAFSARDGRVLVLAAPELPENWTGKSFALQCGAKGAQTPFIVFTDADVIFGAGVIQEAASRMELETLDHLSGHFYVDCRTVAEEICAPVLVVSSSLALFNTARSIGAATGAFNMVRSDAYWRWGGHEPIKGKIVDDVALARHLKGCGARSQFLCLGNRVRVRLFVGFAGYIRAVARSSVPFLNLGAATVSLLALGFGSLVLITLACLSLPVLVSAMPTTQRSIVVSLSWLGPLPYCLGLLSLWMTGAFDNGRKVFRLFYPVAALGLAYGVLQASIVRLGRRPLVWRGRRYALE